MPTNLGHPIYFEWAQQEFIKSIQNVTIYDKYFEDFDSSFYIIREDGQRKLERLPPEILYPALYWGIQRGGETETRCWDVVKNLVCRSCFGTGVCFDIVHWELLSKKCFKSYYYLDFKRMEWPSRFFYRYKCQVCSDCIGHGDKNWYGKMDRLSDIGLQTQR